MTGSLTGRRVIVTRERPGELARLLADRGADVVHVPLIRRVDPDDGGAALADALDRLPSYDWLVVTSPEGARRVGPRAGEHPARIAAVGRATADVLQSITGRTVDLVPERQTGTELGIALHRRTDGPQAVLVAQAAEAAGDVARVLAAEGHRVDTVVAYRTVPVAPEGGSIGDADALVLASGSAARSWVRAFGTATPDVVVAIGPSTAAVARDIGLKVSSVAADHSVAGLVTAVERGFPPLRNDA